MACLVLLCNQHIAKRDKERASDVRVAHTPTVGAGYRAQLALMYNVSIRTPIQRLLRSGGLPPEATATRHYSMPGNSHPQALSCCVTGVCWRRFCQKEGWNNEELRREFSGLDHSLLQKTQAWFKHLHSVVKTVCNSSSRWPDAVVWAMRAHICRKTLIK